MKQPIKKQDIGFTMVANIVLNDPRLSWKAKGLFAYLYSKPDAWDFSHARMVINSTDGRESVMAGLRELEQYNYLVREKLSTGKVAYYLQYKPESEDPTQDQKPESGKPKVGKTLSGKNRLISKIEENSKIEEESNKEYASTSKEVSQMSLEEFIQWTAKSKLRHVNLIGDYAKAVSPDFTTKEQWNAFIKRNLRAARTLAPFTDEQIERAAREMHGADWLSKWTLETIAKFLIK